MAARNDSEMENTYLDKENLNTTEVRIEEINVEDGEKNTTNFSINAEINDDDIPKVGMKFDNMDRLYDFYAKYAYIMGFSFRKRNTKKGSDGLLRNVTLACSREGKKTSSTNNSLEPQPTVQMGCRARLSATSAINGTWSITKVHFEHNHSTSPTKSRLYRCNRKLDERVKRQLEVNDIAGIPLHKTFNSVVVEAGGYENLTFTERDCRNFIEKARRLRLGDGDVVAIQSYFMKMQTSCPGFYFCMDLDDEGHLKNVFWADKRCREAYKEFGDVITFDTTYLTNKYDMPFAPFVGVNHHGHSLLLGCGLVSNEDTETFVWIFKTWLQCMDGQAPMGIITDQDKAMQNAIEVVFPSTKHRWCLWHIMKKLPEKFGNHSLKDLIFSAMHNLVYETQYPEEFESGWAVMIVAYKLEENDWLNVLYNERSRWVPCYLKTSFWAGMSTTQRSESMNSFFDGYVHSKTSLKQFVEQYERALRSKVEKEVDADFKCYSKTTPCATEYEIEKQFQLVYTISKFKEFRKEFTSTIYCKLVSNSVNISENIYEVHEDCFFEGRKKTKKFVVSYKCKECHFCCSCHLFEFKGIICRHSILVLKMNGVTFVPNRYILHRWRKDVKRLYQRVKINYDGWQSTAPQLRYDEVCRAFTKVANLVVDDKEQTKNLLAWLETKFDELTLMKSKPRQIDNTTAQKSIGDDDLIQKNPADDDGLIHILDPKHVKTKGAPKKLRKKGFLETSSKKARVPSKSNKGANNKQNKSTYGSSSNQVVQQIQVPVVNQLSYMELLGTQYQSSMYLYGGHEFSALGGNQALLSMFQQPPQYSEDEIIGTTDNQVIE